MKLNDKVQKRIHLIYGIVLSAMLALIGVLFIVSCYSIYKSGSDPFTRKSIGEAFARIAVPVYLTLALVVIGGAIDVIMPREAKKLTGIRSPKTQVSKLAQRVDVTSAPEDLAAKITKERGLRSLLTKIRLSLFVLSATLPLIYLLNPDNFPAVSGEYNSEILHGMLFYLVCLIPLTAFEIAWVIISDASYLRENEALKASLKAGAQKDGDSEELKTRFATVKEYLKENEKPIKLGVRIAVLGCAALFIVLGIFNGGMADVLNKAINICTECIGLG